MAALLGLGTIAWAVGSGGVGAAWAGTGGAGGAGGNSVSHSDHAVCGSVSPGFSRCFVHLLDSTAPSSATPTGLPPKALTDGYGFSSSLTAGAGQTVAIVDAYDDPTIASDLSAFSTQFGLPQCTGTCFTKVNQTGGTSYPRANSSWGLEISLDVEWVHALAPGANIVLVEASSNSNSNLFAAVSYASTRASYVSMSWGGGESSGETSLDSYFKTGGVSYFAASGDNGAGAEYPSSSPYVVSVGGTTLDLGYNGTSYSFVNETNWSGGGGGCSAYEQAAAAQESFPTFAQAGCGTRRGAPDLSLDADPNTGVSVYDTSGQSGWLTVGGTSASTQFVAAEAAVAKDVMTPSFVYGANLAYFGIPTCTNGEPSVASGYNLCTGLGSWNPAHGSLNGTGGGSTSPPAAPSGVTPTPGDSQVTVSWTASAGASSYTVYADTSSAPSSSSPLQCTTAGTSCTVTSLTNGTPYYFDVVATNSAGDSPASTVVTATPQAGAAQTVSVSSISYFLSGRRGSTLNFTVALSPAVSGASVSVTLYHNGSVYGSATGTTGTGGTVGFHASNAPSGSYTTTVTNVSATGYTWDGTTPSNSFNK